MLMNKARRQGLLALLLVYGAVMLWLLLDRDRAAPGVDYWDQVEASLNLKPFHTIMLYVNLLTDFDNTNNMIAAVVNLFGNVAMFIPLGIFLPALWKPLRKWWICLLCIALIMTVVELVQLFTLRGYCDVDDLILNVLGGALGYGVWKAHAKPHARKKR